MNNLLIPELIRIPFSRLSKLELPEFAERVTGVVEKHNPEELQIKEIFDLLVAEKPNIDKLEVRRGAHPLTVELRKLREMRALYVCAIEFHLKVVIKKDLSGTNKDVEVAKIEINRFLHDLRSSKNNQIINRKITQFFQAVESSLELSEALSALDFIPLMDELKSAHSSIQRVIDARTSSISERSDDTTAQLTKGVLKATKDLIKQIEIAPLKHLALDYKPLFKELNVILIEYRDLINNRILFNKRKAEMANAEDGQTTESSPITEFTETAERMLQLDAKEEYMTGLENKSVDKEKAAAMSSKTMQLPLVNDNGDLKK